MRIPREYCPNCKRFKKWYQVTNVDAINYGYCKHCGTRCIDTEEMLEDYVEEIIKNSEKITKKVRLGSLKEGDVFYYNGEAYKADADVIGSRRCINLRTTKCERISFDEEVEVEE